MSKRKYKDIDEPTNNLRVKSIQNIVSPNNLLSKYKITKKVENFVLTGRTEIENVIDREDDRLIVIVGPCSIHNPEEAYDYAKKLREIVDRVSDTLIIVMRCYFEKPRTTIGWKGLINDPDLDDSNQINKGIDIARKLLLNICKLGLYVGCEFLDCTTPQYFSDLVVWGAIGARTVESQVHRQLASGLSMPIGFKNGTGGSIDIAADAVVSAQYPHTFLGISSTGEGSVISTTGNDKCHIILRGGKDKTNYDAESVKDACNILDKKSLMKNIVIDCSHGNSRKNHKNQILVAHNIAEQILNGDQNIIGVMIESNINEGRQDIGTNKKLKYGVSVTDACISWEITRSLLLILDDSVRRRRNKINLI